MQIEIKREEGQLKLISPLLHAGGAFISQNMEMVPASGGLGSRNCKRSWRCRLCCLQGSEAVVALHINEAH